MRSSRVCWISLIMALVMSPVVAQTGFVVAPSQISGIRIDGPETPEFTKHISDLAIGAETLAAAQAYLARAVVITNMTDQPVTGFVVRFEYVDTTGAMRSVTQWQEPHGGIAAGAIRLVGESEAATEGMRAHGPEDRVLQSIRKATSGPMMRSQFVRASVDSVVFANGDFVGPDVFGAWGMLEREQEFIRSTRTELEQIGADMEQVQRKLAEIKKPIPNQAGRITLVREKFYGLLITPARAGFEPFRAKLQAQFGEPTLPVLRRF